MIDISVLRALVAAGTTPEAMLAVLEAQVDADDKRRRKAALRKQKYRMSLGHPGTSRDMTGHDGTSGDTTQEQAPAVPVETQTVVADTPKTDGTKNLFSLSSNSSLEDSLGTRGSEDTRARDRKYRAEFDEWYAGYPHKVARAAALKAFLKARKSGTALETMIAGRERYKQNKPSDIAWCNPASWLNGERWTDQPAEQAPRAPPKSSSGAAAIVRKLQENYDVYEDTDDHTGPTIDGTADPPENDCASAA